MGPELNIDTIENAISAAKQVSDRISRLEEILPNEEHLVVLAAGVIHMMNAYDAAMLFIQNKLGEDIMSEYDTFARNKISEINSRTTRRS